MSPRKQLRCSEMGQVRRRADDPQSLKLLCVALLTLYLKQPFRTMRPRRVDKQNHRTKSD